MKFWACFNTLIPSHWIEVDIERLLFSLAVRMPNFWGPGIEQKGDQCFYQMSDFCKNCNPHSSYHTTAIGECLVDIWIAGICQLTEVNPTPIECESVYQYHWFPRACIELNCTQDFPHCVYYKLRLGIFGNFAPGYSRLISGGILGSRKLPLLRKSYTHCMISNYQHTSVNRIVIARNRKPLCSDLPFKMRWFRPWI